MENLLSILAFCLIWLPFCLILLFIMVCLFVYMYKSADYENNYLRSLDKESRSLYNDISLHKRMPLSYIFKKKAVVHNEDK